MAHAYRTARRVGRMPAAASAHLQRCALRSPCLPPGVGPWPGLGCSGLRRAQVGLNACSMTMCGLMLESILESASEFVSVTEEARFLQRCRLFACGCGLLPYTPAAARARTRMRCWCPAAASCKVGPRAALYVWGRIRHGYGSCLMAHPTLSGASVASGRSCPLTGVRMHSAHFETAWHGPSMCWVDRRACPCPDTEARGPQLQAGRPAAGAAAHVQQALGGAVRGRVPARVLHVLRQCAHPGTLTSDPY